MQLNKLDPVKLYEQINAGEGRDKTNTTDKKKFDDYLNKTGFKAAEDERRNPSEKQPFSKINSEKASSEDTATKEATEDNITALMSYLNSLINKTNNETIFCEEATKHETLTLFQGTENLILLISDALKSINSKEHSALLKSMDSNIASTNSDYSKQVLDIVTMLQQLGDTIGNEDISREILNIMGLDSESMEGQLINNKLISALSASQFQGNNKLISKNKEEKLDAKGEERETRISYVDISKDHKKVNFEDSSKGGYGKGAEDKQLIKEESFLKSLSGSKDEITDKINSFPAHLNRFMDNPSAVEKTSEVPAVNKNTLANDVIKVMKYMEGKDLKELIVKVAPKELGEITIRLTLQGGVYRANIAAKNVETVSLLNASLSDIKGTLENTAIKVQEVNISVYNEDTTFFKDYESSSQFSGEQKGKESSREQEQKDEITVDTVTKEGLSGDNYLSALA